MKHAFQFIPKALGPSTFVLAIWLLAMLGCGREPRTPLEQATFHFQRAQFDAAIKAVDQAVAGEKQPERIAELLVIKGRCFWEMANQADAAETKTALLQNAVETFAKSIDADDNAEARHIRAMVYEAMGENELAVADKTVARRLDESYRRAYINEKPEEVLLDLGEFGPVPRPSETAVEDADDVDATPARRPADYAADDDVDDPGLSRQGDVPWTAQSPRADTARSESTAQNPPDAERKPTDAGRRRRTAATSGLVANGTLPNAEVDADSESDASGEDDTQETPSDDPRGEQTATTPPIPPRAPGSTWQPLVPPTLYGGGVPLPSGPTTGISGPDVGAESPSPGSTAAPFGSQPTTGITGPSGFRRPLAPPTSTATSPTTGIGAGPLNSAMPSGVPSPFIPQSALPRLPFTGALPPQHQPPGVVPQIGPSLPTHGPNYSPLYPSPLTAPGAQRSGLGAPQGAGVPSASTSPLSLPKARKPLPTITPTTPPVAPR